MARRASFVKSSRRFRFERFLLFLSPFLMLPMFLYVTVMLSRNLTTTTFSALPHELIARLHGRSVGDLPAEEEQMLIKTEVDEQGVISLVRETVKAPTKEKLAPLTEAAEVPPIPKCMSAGRRAAPVNITSHQLYEEIGFKDEAGGTWTQGWPVTYKGDEWERRKLRVFVVPHSHNDPGWIRTVLEYYNEKTRNILNTVVSALVKDSRRRFIWEEISYLSLWWAEASQVKKDQLKWLIENGQLEIVGGGWVMNDEANSHHFAIIDQTLEGHAWILDNIGPEALPQNAWQIDPFGHSSTMAYVNHLFGFRNMLIQRVHYEVKKALARNQSLEFFWRQPWDTAGHSDIVCHMMPFYSYDIPHTCGPEPAVCCQFDFNRLPEARSGMSCPWNIPPVAVTNVNVEERSLKILDQWRKKSTLYRTSALLVPLGDDFRYTSEHEAELQYNNFQAIFDYVNKQPELHVEAQFGTLADYFRALRTELAVDHRYPTADTAPWDQPLPPPQSLPSLSGDFFTYADRVHDYWSGYYVSRPFYKSLDRVLEDRLRAAEIIYTLATATCSRVPQPAEGNEEEDGNATSILLAGFHPHLSIARQQLAVFQHHDGITGTAKNHVMLDYASRMHGSLGALGLFMGRALPLLLSGGLKGCGDGAGREQWEPEEFRPAHDLLPRKLRIDITPGRAQRVVFFNSREQVAEEVVSVEVGAAAVCVLDADLRPVIGQVNPNWDGRKRGRDAYLLLWRANVPAMGAATYFVVGVGEVAGCQLAEEAAVEVFRAPPEFQCQTPFVCTSPGVSEVTITNRRLSLTFDALEGLLTGMTQPGASSTGRVRMDEEYRVYHTKESGAYLFRPLGEAQQVTKPGGAMFVSRGPLMQEVRSELATIWGTSNPIIRTARLYSGATVQAAVAEMRHTVDMSCALCNNNELVVRYSTDVDSRDDFFTDLNGFQVIRRRTYSKIPLQGNFYPMPQLAYIEDKRHRFSVHTRQALGVASLHRGALEVMLDRRLMQDDNRGLFQSVTDNHPNNVVFHLLLEGRPESGPPLAAGIPHPSLLSHRVTSLLAHPPIAFLADPEEVPKEAPALAAAFSPLTRDLPCNVRVLNLKTQRPPSTSRAPAAATILLHRLGYDCALPSTGPPEGAHVLEPVKRLELGGSQSHYQGPKEPACAVFEEGDAFGVVGMFSGFDVEGVQRATLSQQPLVQQSVSAGLHQRSRGSRQGRHRKEILRQEEEEDAEEQDEEPGLDSGEGLGLQEMEIAVVRADIVKRTHRLHLNV